jgi:hypothetical protein
MIRHAAPLALLLAGPPTPAFAQPCPDAVRRLALLAPAQGACAVPSARAALDELPAVIDRPACRQAAAAAVRALATGWHKLVVGKAPIQPEEREALAMGAQLLYQAYHQRFPEQPDRVLLRFYQAELLYWLGVHDTPPGDTSWFCDAEPIYDEVMRAEPASERRSEAAYAMVLARAHCLHFDEGPYDPDHYYMAERIAAHKRWHQEHPLGPDYVPRARRR